MSHAARASSAARIATTTSRAVAIGCAVAAGRATGTVGSRIAAAGYVVIRSDNRRISVANTGRTASSHVIAMSSATIGHDVAISAIATNVVVHHSAAIGHAASRRGCSTQICALITQSCALAALAAASTIAAPQHTPFRHAHAGHCEHVDGLLRSNEAAVMAGVNVLPKHQRCAFAQCRRRSPARVHKRACGSPSVAKVVKGFHLAHLNQVGRRVV